MEDYKSRMRNEYFEVKGRYDKLHSMLVRHDAGMLNFTLNCPVQVLRDQAAAMGKYLYILEVRAAIEGVDLSECCTCSSVGSAESHGIA